MTEGGNYLTPEARARVQIDRMLTLAGWVIQDRDDVDLYAGTRRRRARVPVSKSSEEADYLLFVDSQAVGALEAKKEGTTLSGVEPQTGKYAAGLPEPISAPIRPLPFLYESTGVETWFTNGLDPVSSQPRSVRDSPARDARTWVSEWVSNAAAPTLRARLHHLPEIDASALWPAQETGNRRAREVARSRPSPVPHPDGDRRRQDVHRSERRRGG